MASANKITIQSDKSNANRGTPRGHSIIERSIRQHGAGRSGLAAKDGTLIAGNQTWDEMSALGIPIKEVHTTGDEWVVVVRDDVEPESEQATMMALEDNRSSAVGLSWDPIVLAQLSQKMDLSPLWTTEELQEVLSSDGVGNGENPLEDVGPQIDKAEELRKKWGVESGQLWALGDHRLLCGDSTKREDVERVMGGEKADMSWCDPPFGIELVPQRGLTKTIINDKNEDARSLWATFLPLLHDHLQDHAHIFLCQGWTEFEWTCPLLRQSGYTIKSKIVWNKNVWGIGYYTRPKHEDILYCWKGQPEKPPEPVADVWDIARESAPEHAAEKPPALSSMAISHFSTSGNIVADWFCGVGGSLIACENLHRKARAVEISPGYVAVCLERWSTLTGKQPKLLS